MLIHCVEHEKILAKVYYNISKQYKYEMENILMNSFRLLFKLTDKIEFRRGEKSVGFSNPSIY